MEGRYQANGHDKAEGALPKRKAVCIAQAGENGRAHPGASRVRSSGIQHVCDGVHRPHPITALRQCHDAQSGPAPDFENLSPERIPGKLLAGVPDFTFDLWPLVAFRVELPWIHSSSVPASQLARRSLYREGCSIAWSRENLDQAPSRCLDRIS